MKKQVLERVEAALPQTSRIRNISVIAHVDHGKSTLSDSLVARSGLIADAKAGDARFLDTRPDEQERTITIKSTSISLVFDVKPPKSKHLPQKGEWKPGQEPAEADVKVADDAKVEPDAAEATVPYLINLIDSPGHVDFSSEVTAALRVCDGGFVVVDCAEGVCVQTETVLRQALAERVKPVLFLNKLDRLFLELHMDAESAYQTLSRCIESVNVVISTSVDELLGDVTVYPQAGNVGFGSGLHGWGFTLQQFARMYHDKFGVSVKKMMKKLWGENYWDDKTKSWSTSATKNGRALQRGFNLLVWEPIQKLFDAVMKGDKPTYTKFLKRQGLAMPRDAEEKELEGKALLKRIMQTWLPAADAMLELIVEHLPDPATAQKYRVHNLYSGPQDDEAATAIRNCDPNGPLMMYVSKMVPTADASRFYAFGRIFSGTLHAGDSVQIQGPEYRVGNKNDMHTAKISSTVCMMGPKVANCGTFFPGNMVGIVGIDNYLLKSGTITTCRDAHNFVDMKYTVAPIVRVAVEVVNPAHLAKLNQGLRRLAKSDPLVQVFQAPTGEHIVAGCGELHLEICLKDLQEDFLNGVALKVSDPVVPFRESISAQSSQVCLAKSANKHNRLFMTAEPLGDPFCAAVDAGLLYPPAPADADGWRTFSRHLVTEFNWDASDSRRIWSFGLPPDGQANVLVDVTKGVQYLHNVKDSVAGAFGKCTLGGVLMDEPMRGCRFNLTDAKLHSDSPHRGGGQIMPATTQVLYACQLASKPCVLEPMYSCTITVPTSSVAGVYATLRARRAEIDVSGHVEMPGDMLQIKAFLPVAQSIGFSKDLRSNTGGRAFPQTVFSHWSVMPGDLMAEDSLPRNTVMEVRARKGLKLAFPELNDYHDKL